MQPTEREVNLHNLLVEKLYQDLPGSTALKRLEYDETFRERTDLQRRILGSIEIKA